MKQLFRLCVSAIACLAATQAVTSAKAANSTPAELTFKVTKFRPATSVTDSTQYTDANMTLAPHEAVKLTSSGALSPKRAIDFAIKIESVDNESYTPLAIFFQQRNQDAGVRSDPDGKINFAPGQLSGPVLVFHDTFARTGTEYRYEFFVLIQRRSDGAIGIIDPEIVHEDEE